MYNDLQWLSRFRFRLQANKAIFVYVLGDEPDRICIGVDNQEVILQYQYGLIRLYA